MKSYHWKREPPCTDSFIHYPQLHTHSEKVEQVSWKKLARVRESEKVEEKGVRERIEEWKRGGRERESKWKRGGRVEGEREERERKESVLLSSSNSYSCSKKARITTEEKRK